MSGFLTLLSACLLVAGTAFALLGALGVIRMPDFYMRVQTTSKSVTLGAASVLMAAAVHFGDMSIVMRAIMILAFLFLTTPIAAHVLSRVAYQSGTPVSPETRWDELAGRYDVKGTLASHGDNTTPDTAAPDEPTPGR